MTPLLIDTTLTLFDGPSYTQYDTRTGQPQYTYPRLIADGWNLPFTTIDAALNWGDGTVYFVSRMQVIRYSIDKQAVMPGYPKVLPFYWRGLWPADLDAAFRGGDRAFFFRKHEYIQFNVAANHADYGGPLPIAGVWNGLPNQLTGAVPLTSDYLLFFNKQTVYVYDLPANQVVAGPLLFAEFIREGVPAFVERLTGKPYHQSTMP